MFMRMKSSPLGHHPKCLKGLGKMKKTTVPVIAPTQLHLELQIAAEREVDGVGMGVLSDGRSFLTLRGLARMCGVDNAAIVRMTAAWTENPLEPLPFRLGWLL